ncbi:acyl-CoA dehydrogenase [Marinobacter sp. EVN1]|jgi:alkylation response protein AidB-like acyl-CoA dehydrogenase|uniref:acyl-CoA dehydrogenase C-terminal domain-containing protein n=1 Tax=Marinobacter TaxID=2742 RepID=UPI0003B7F87B|nr:MULTISPECIES: acyl-CoA dehydrogenase C-terminal domain-containing protein [Marinobacter]MEC8898086.1 acyl-CoA dehydrogenase C-terminal domain-containing protein [Pseudomonadota bacterium]ERS84387.1 acyl-CoA dehydrogenase [Marinobacter sp. EVN1]ERS89707.1 acyl-CoA dehydrogenase [Marinobacter sp. C1S70]MBY5961208.1 acyl-CoA dehydrogenase C-terminal domain-containing protein [Marinobacter nauticus]MEC9388247.1 acyl-CoA dehydrogenase C-terminal domain-containing protein [Pseudomonadota bacteriu
MADYQAPLRDMRFVLNEVFDAPSLWASLPKIAENVDPDTADAILEEAGKITSGVLAPLNREADEQGCKWNEGEVSTPEGFKEAYQTIVEGGWNGLGGNPDFGGMGMPKTLVAQFEEMMQGANMAFGLAPMLTAGACLALDAHGSQELKEKYLPNMYSGVWSGAMDLTEPHAGTDLGIIRTKAEPNDDGSFNITGTKIFITWGEHDMAENIIHLVLAKLPDAPKGPKGISLFLVPKFMVNDDGSLGERNQFSCGSIEKKMGIKGSATCVMNFDGAKGWLVGEENKGLAAMFTMMNYERLGVGIQGIGAAEASLQSAREYANERIQSRAPTGAQQPEKAADPILVHPDVRRMLMTMKSYVEGGRAFSTYVAQWLDISKYSDNDEQRKHAEGMVALLTPVAKAFLTDRGLDTTIIGQQVFGGHGFIREWGQEQLVRDCRITQIYEGTNGIQAMDLMGRKVVGSQGKLYELFAQDVAAFIEANSSDEALRPYLEPLAASLERLSDVTEHVVNQAANNPEAIGAAAVDYLDMFGYTALAYMWAKVVKAAAPKAESDTSGFYTGKVKTARFYFDRLLPKTVSLAEGIRSGSDAMMAPAANEI